VLRVDSGEPDSLCAWGKAKIQPKIGSSICDRMDSEVLLLARLLARVQTVGPRARCEQVPCFLPFNNARFSTDALIVQSLLAEATTRDNLAERRSYTHYGIQASAESITNPRCHVVSCGRC
jgi:hypothetical protein